MDLQESQARAQLRKPAGAPFEPQNWKDVRPDTAI